MNTQRWAENDLRHGWRGQLFKRLLELYSRKSAVGGGSAKAINRILSTHPNLSKEEALKLRRRQLVKELCEVHVTESGYKARKFSARPASVRLSVGAQRVYSRTQLALQ
jgi:hypothetical protein